MNDRYLFKAKRIDWRELPKEEWWAYGNWVQIEERIYIVCEAETSCMDGENTDFYATEWYEINPSTLCACTGLKDKNGTLIWESDIIKCQDIIGKVGWNETLLAFTVLEKTNGNRWYYYIDDSIDGCIEVIGNIFDNPELLEVE